MNLTRDDELRKNRFRRLKRAIDVSAVIVTAPLSLPIGAVTASLVLVRLGRPIIYRQKRIGLEEKEFDLLKFRTMVEARGPHGELLADRERLTPLGQALRRLSLDEIPQLLNVLRGEMSLVGPRPLYTHYLRSYTPSERMRHTVLPGITGLAQVSGRNDILWNRRLALDVEYAARPSARQDTRILLMTALRIVRGSSGVSVVAGDSGEPLDIARNYPSVDGHTMRRFESADIPSRVQWMNADSIREHMTLPTTVSHEETERWLTRVRKIPGRFDFTVTEVGSDEPVAMMGLTPRDGEQDPELYMFVKPGRISEGLGTTALGILTRWMARPENPSTCWLSVEQSNLRAVRLYQKFGFVVTGGSGTDRIRMEWSASQTASISK